MRLVLIAAVVLAGCNACQPTPSPVPPPGPAPTPTAQRIYAELVEAGYLAPDDGGAAAVQQELQSDVVPPWLICLQNGGSPQACNVPQE